MNTNWTTTAGGFRYSGPSIEAQMTADGAQLAPVTFNLDNRPVSPYFISPWQGENLVIDTPVLRPLRGNFFCLPFGAGGPDRSGRIFTPHGEVASSPWTFEGAENTAGGDRIELSMLPGDIGGRAAKIVEMDDDTSSIFTEVSIDGVNGDYPVAYHPNLRMPFTGRMYLSLSPWETARVMPRRSLQYQGGEYYDLVPGARIDDLSRVPTLAGGFSDCTTFPRVEGFLDLVAVYRSPSCDLAWSFAAYPEEGFAWYSLKSSRTFGATLLWMENAGRHQSPWNGRTAVLGIEDITSYFADSVGVSQGQNDLNTIGYPTCSHFEAETTSRFPYIEGVTAIPRGFTRVASAGPTAAGFAFTSASGQVVEIGIGAEKLGRL